MFKPSALTFILVPFLGLMLTACSGALQQPAHLLPLSSDLTITSAVVPIPEMTDSRTPVPVQTLARLSGKELITRFGRPDFKRKDPPAEIWQYRSTSCVLDVFLYPEIDDLHVAHAVTRDPSSMRASSVSCSPFSSGERVAANG